MVETSIIIPARNEQFLNKTIEDVLAKARGEIEIIAVLDGYWPDPIIQEERVHYIHFTARRGMRPCLNAGVESARGRYVMKLDAHCMVAEGFDVVLAEACQDDWVCVPTRQRLDAENWCIKDDGRRPINYLWMDLSNDGMNFKEWHQKNVDRSLDAIEIDDILSMQGSCYFMPRAYWHKLELLDTENYGTFRKDPQEVAFKAWLSGGRVVRVKTTWYAHLHKGKQYGRGYTTSQADWAKGDEYVKKWRTDEAWDKATKPFSWLLSKFPDMLGGDVLEPEPEPPPPPPLADTRALPNTYQYLEVDGVPFTRPRPDRVGSRFWNEGKWHTFVEPLLPEDVTGQTFVEMGCDAGLFLKLATDHGYGRVIGVEKNRTPARVGHEWRDRVGGNWTILKHTLGGQFGEDGSFDIDELPVADVTLMSTFHYHIDMNAWTKYVDRLAAKTCYVLIVSRPTMRREHWRAGAEPAQVRSYFENWEEMGWVKNVPTAGDPKPRELYSILFKSPIIERVGLDAIRTTSKSSDAMEMAKAELARQIAQGEEFDLYQSEFYRCWEQRKGGKWSPRVIRRLVQLKADVMRGVMVDGLRDPLLVGGNDYMLIDGGHRLAMLKALGHTSAIVRQVL